ncbi:MAG: protein phosphatase 2C domain-containing protein [Bacteroidota bacterium]
MAVKILQLHKRASYEFKYIQDKYAFDAGNLCYAIADGTTQSLNSDIWAEIITKDFVKSPEFDPQALIRKFQQSAQDFRACPFTFSDNPAKASLEREKLKRGATATFIGLRFKDEQNAEIISLGDSNVFIVRQGQNEYFPFSNAADLDNNTHFLNTEKLLSNETEPGFFVTGNIKIQKNDRIILATDALSRLLLRNPECVNELLQIESFKNFEQFCLKYWEAKLLEEDDISALIISHFGSATVKALLPPKGYSFPREEEIEFVPGQQPVFEPNNPYSDYDMQQLLNTISRLSDELRLIKRKASLLETLILLAIGLIVINMGIIVYFRYEMGNLKEMASAGTKGQQAKTEKESSGFDIKGGLEKIKEKITGKDSVEHVKTTVAKPEPKAETKPAKAAGSTPANAPAPTAKTGTAPESPKTGSPVKK